MEHEHRTKTKANSLNTHPNGQLQVAPFDVRMFESLLLNVRRDVLQPFLAFVGGQRLQLGGQKQ